MKTHSPAVIRKHSQSDKIQPHATDLPVSCQLFL